MIPSICKMLVKHIRSAFAVDGACLRGVFGGVTLTVVGYYGNDEVCTLAWAIVDAESRSNWEWFLSLVFEDLCVPDLILSGKASGIQPIKQGFESFRQRNNQGSKKKSCALYVRRSRCPKCRYHQ